MDLEPEIQIALSILVFSTSLFFCHSKLKLPYDIIIKSFSLSIVSIMLAAFPQLLFYKIYLEYAPGENPYIATAMGSILFWITPLLVPYIVTFLYLKYKKLYTMLAFLFLAAPFTICLPFVALIYITSQSFHISFLEFIMPSDIPL